MGLFKKKQSGGWIDDLGQIVSADPGYFSNMRRYDDSTQIVTLDGETEVWISDSGKDLCFVVGLDNIGKMAERFGLPVSEAYKEMTQYVKGCSLGLDTEYNMRFATVLSKDGYTSDALRDLMYRWIFQIDDYNSAFETFIEKHQEDSA